MNRSRLKTLQNCFLLFQRVNAAMDFFLLQFTIENSQETRFTCLVEPPIVKSLFLDEAPSRGRIIETKLITTTIG